MLLPSVDFARHAVPCLKRLRKKPALQKLVTHDFLAALECVVQHLHHVQLQADSTEDDLFAELHQIHLEAMSTTAAQSDDKVICSYT